MYESFFGLSQRPFAPGPLADRYFPAASTDAARQTLARCAERAEGTGLLIGPPGIGKSLLLAVLAEQFRERFRVAVLCGGVLQTRRELLQAILFELQLPYQAKDEGELRLALVDHLARGEHCPEGLLLLVDEAHALPTLLLEELRMMTNVMRQGEPRVRLVLAGGMALEEKLADPALEALSQRLTARCYLDSFDRAETMDYVRFQVAIAGGKAEDTFEPAALEAVHQATGGVPRLVNQVCDHALLLGCQNKQRPIASENIQEAWADLQQLPAPWQGAPRSEGVSGGVVEFGGLDDVEPESGSPFDDVTVSADELADNLAPIDGQLAAEVHDECPDDAIAEESQDDVLEFTESVAADDAIEELTVQEPADERTEHQAVQPVASDEDKSKPQTENTMFEAEAALERIQQQVEELAGEPSGSAEATAGSEVCDEQPTVEESQAGATLGWTLSLDDFDEEEVLFDPYAQLDSQQQSAAASAAPVSNSAASPTTGDMTAEQAHVERAPDSGDAPAAEPEATNDEEPSDDVHWSADDDQVEVVVDPYAGLRDTDHHPSALAAEAREIVDSEIMDSEVADEDVAEDELDIEVNDDASVESQAERAAEERPRNGGQEAQSTIPLSEVIRLRHDAEFIEETESGMDDTEPATASQASEPQATSDGLGRDDLIILEDGDASSGPPPRVERQDYRRLFARLRNG